MPWPAFKNNRSLGRNQFGILESQKPRRQGPIDGPGGTIYDLSAGGVLRPTTKQTAWRVQCPQIGQYGGYEIMVGIQSKVITSDSGQKIDIFISDKKDMHVESIGMLSNDWSPLTITRVY